MNVKQIRKLVRQLERASFAAGNTAGRGHTRKLAEDLAHVRECRNELVEYLLAQATKDAAKEITTTQVDNR